MADIENNWFVRSIKSFLYWLHTIGSLCSMWRLKRNWYQPSISIANISIWDIRLSYWILEKGARYRKLLIQMREFNFSSYYVLYFKLLSRHILKDILTTCCKVELKFSNGKHIRISANENLHILPPGGKDTDKQSSWVWV